MYKKTLLSVRNFEEVSEFIYSIPLSSRLREPRRMYSKKQIEIQIENW